MRAVQANSGTVAVREVDRPTGPGVRVRVRAAGICGSDLHLVEEGLVAESTTLGHEIAGVTDDGTPVAVEPLDPCDRCDPCRRGDRHLCTMSGGMIFGIGLDGGMADEILVPESAIVPLPVGVPIADAFLVEPLAVVVHSARRAEIGPGDRVLVIGGGTIGLCAVAVARAAGADVALAARHDAQRSAGERLGATEPGDGYDVVIEAAGTESALTTAVELVRPGAAVVIPGIYWGPISIPGMTMCFKEIALCPTTLYSRHAGGRDVDAAAALLATTPDLAPTLITHRFPLDDAPSAFDVAGDRSSGAIKVVLEP